MLGLHRWEVLSSLIVEQWVVGRHVWATSSFPRASRCCCRASLIPKALACKSSIVRSLLVMFPSALAAANTSRYCNSCIVWASGIRAVDRLENARRMGRRRAMSGTPTTSAALASPTSRSPASTTSRGSARSCSVTHRSPTSPSSPVWSLGSCSTARRSASACERWARPPPPPMPFAPPPPPATTKTSAVVPAGTEVKVVNVNGTKLEVQTNEE